MAKKQGILYGDGTKNCPYYIQGFRNQEFTKIQTGLEICKEAGINRLNIAYSGRYYELREDGFWYETSDSLTCDAIHGLPPEGRRVRSGQ